MCNVGLREREEVERVSKREMEGGGGGLLHLFLYLFSYIVQCKAPCASEE